MEKQKFILDTDIGDDIDDALALALAMHMPEVELIGVTTVFLDTDKRARIAGKLLRLWGCEAPVYAGLRRGEKLQNVNVVPCQYTQDLAGPEYAPVNDLAQDGGAGAVEFIVEAAKKYGPELTVVAIGPLTNVAEAIRMAPEAMKRIRIVLMGGCFYRQFSEWNILCDPDGAKTVLDSGCNVTCVGVEVTEQTKLSDRQQQLIMSDDRDERYRYLAQLVRLHNAYTHNNVCLHDPLTLYYCVHSDIITTEQLLVRVETQGQITAGMTVNMDEMFHYLKEPLPGTRITVAKTVERDRFMTEFFETVYTGLNASEGKEG